MPSSGALGAIDSVYADYNATSPLRPAARVAMLQAMEATGNASSIHRFGRNARALVEGARASVLRDLDLKGYDLTFVSGASEALAMVLRPSTRSPAKQRPVQRLLISSCEHVAALEGHRFEQAELLPVTAGGVLDLLVLEAALKAQGAETLVCVQGANNETGVLQPLARIEELCRQHGALLVCDMVQWAGRLPRAGTHADAIIISAHKFGGPSGVGALIHNPASLLPGPALVSGGGQERGMRAGTENLLGIAGLAAALHEAVEAMPGEQAGIAQLRDGFEEGLLKQHCEAVIFGRSEDRLGNTSCFALPGHEAALALMQLDLDGIAISSGAACSSGKVKASHVLAAMGVDDALTRCALRVSFGFNSTRNDVARLLASLARWTKRAC